MIVLYFLIPIAILLAAGALYGFVWSVRNGQYEDTTTPAYRLLWDDKAISKNGTLNQNCTTKQN